MVKGLLWVLKNKCQTSAIPSVKISIKKSGGNVASVVISRVTSTSVYVTKFLRDNVLWLCLKTV